MNSIEHAKDGVQECEACGSRLHPGRVAGLCPACAWQAALATPLEEPESPRSPRPPGGAFEVAGHLVIEEIDRGGMGIVYRARQREPQREVALKMLLPHQLGSAGLIERFRLEARAIAGLEHPAILPVYQVGEHDGIPFFTMKLAVGGSLAGHISQYRGQFAQIARLVARVAEAVNFAHERGVLHRDLKPGNILFDEEGRAYVSDFGLAKIANSDSEFTQSADLLGTPRYLAPEIAASNARQATTSSDVYALGAILYELLSGRPPFEAEGMPALLKKITEEEPPALPASVPRDLAVICLKCLAKEPGRRFGTAREVADDLNRWLAGKPISARPFTAAERVWRWARRNPVLASTAAALAICLFAGGIALWRSDLEVRSALTATRDAEKAARENLRGALLAQAQALGAAQNTGQRWQALSVLAEAARIRPSSELRNEAAAALARWDLREKVRFEAQFGAAGSPVAFTSDLRSYIAPEPTGGFVLRATQDQALLASFPDPSGKPAQWFVLSPDDRYVSAVLQDYSLAIWSIDGSELIARWPGHAQQPPVAEFHPDGKRIACYVPGEGLFLQRYNGTERVTFGTNAARAIYLRFDRLGERLAVVRDPGGVELWDCRGIPKQVWARPMRRAVPWLTWHPNGSQLAAAADDGRGLRILSAKDGQIEMVYTRHLLYPRQFEFAPDGRLMASIGQDWVLRLWDPRSGADLVAAVGRHRVMRFSRDGSLLSTAPTDHELAVLEFAPNRVFREFASAPSGSEVTPSGLARTSNDRLLLISDPEVRLYDSLLEKELTVQGLPNVLNGQRAFFDSAGASLLYNRQGQGLFRRTLSCDTNATTQELLVRGSEEQMIAHNPNGIVWNTAEGGRTWVNYAGSVIELWPDGDSKQARQVNVHLPLSGAATSQDARWVACADPVHQLVTVFEPASGNVVTNLSAPGPGRVWFSPDSRWLVASVQRGYCTWQTESWAAGPSCDARLDTGDPGEITFTDDSRLAAVRQERGTFKLITFPGCHELVTLKPPLVLAVRSACLSAQGKRLWLLANGYRLFAWNLGELRGELTQLGLDWSSELP